MRNVIYKIAACSALVALVLLAVKNLFWRKIQMDIFHLTR